MPLGQVFISHSSQDKPFVEKLVADLSVNAIPVWYDKLDLGVGESVCDANRNSKLRLLRGDGSHRNGSATSRIVASRTYDQPRRLTPVCTQTKISCHLFGPAALEPPNGGLEEFNPLFLRHSQPDST